MRATSLHTALAITLTLCTAAPWAAAQERCNHINGIGSEIPDGKVYHCDKGFLVHVGKLTCLRGKATTRKLAADVYDPTAGQHCELGLVLGPNNGMCVRKDQMKWTTYNKLKSAVGTMAVCDPETGIATYR